MVSGSLESRVIDSELQIFYSRCAAERICAVDGESSTRIALNEYFFAMRRFCEVIYCDRSNYYDASASLRSFFKSSGKGCGRGQGRTAAVAFSFCKNFDEIFNCIKVLSKQFDCAGS